MKSKSFAVAGTLGSLLGVFSLLSSDLCPRASALTAGNPYAGPVTERNLFALKPPPDPASLIPQAPPPVVPNVLLAGITTILGGKRALLRVPRPARPPAPAQEISLTLAEGGPAEEGVRVLAIDIAAATVKIDNNGTVQTLDLAKNAPKAPAGAAPGAIPMPPGNPNSAIPVPKPAPVPGGVASIARPIRGAGPTTSGGSTGGFNPSGGLLGAGPTGVPEPQAPPPLTLEEQTVMIEVNRIRTQAQVDAGDLPPLPPTDLSEVLQQEQQGQTPAPPPF